MQTCPGNPSDSPGSTRSTITADGDHALAPVNLPPEIDPTPSQGFADDPGNPPAGVLTALAAASARMLGPKSVEELLQIAVDAARQLTGARLGTCGHHYTDGAFAVEACSLAAGRGAGPVEGTPQVIRCSDYLELIQQNVSIRMTDQEMASHPVWRNLPRSHVSLRGILAAQLVDDQRRPDGLLMVSDKEHGDFTATDEIVLQQLAAVTSLALQHAEARDAAGIASRAKDRFLAMLSHELRTPLTPILLTASSLCCDPHVPQQYREPLLAIRNNVELEARLIDDLLDLTQVSTGKLPLNRRRVDVHELLAQTLPMVRADADAKKLTIAAQLNAERRWVDADPARLRQVFWNLLRNAVQYTPDGGRIDIRTADREQRLAVEFADTGVGITPEGIDKIFHAFERGTPGMARFGGLGLGLAISKSLVELHGGMLAAASPGKDRGSTFTIELPCAVAGQAPPPPPAPPAAMRILLVEDNPSTRKVMLKLLKFLKHDVLAASCFQEALTLAANGPFDLLISDIGLPDGSGLDLMPKLLSAGQVRRGIAVSGYGDEKDCQRSLDAGFVAHLIKPIDMETLQDAIARATAG